MTAFEATVTVRQVITFELDEYEAAVTEAEATMAAVESGVAVSEAPVEIVDAEPAAELSVAEASGNRTEALEAEGKGAAAEAERLAAELGEDVLVEEVRRT